MNTWLIRLLLVLGVIMVLIGIAMPVFGQQPVPDVGIVSLTDRSDDAEERMPLRHTKDGAVLTLQLERLDEEAPLGPSAFATEYGNYEGRVIRLAGGTYDWGGCGRRRCMTCLDNHLRGIQHGITNLNYLRKVGANQWAAIHDNLHNGGRGCVNVPHRHTDYFFTGEVKRFDDTATLSVPSWYNSMVALPGPGTTTAWTYAPSPVWYSTSTPVRRYTPATTWYYNPAPTTTYTRWQTW